MTPADAPAPGPSRGVLGDAVRLSVGTLTAIPVPPPGRVDRRVAGAAMLLAPLAILPLGLAAALLGALLLPTAAPPVLTAALLVGALALGTRAMHLDGLADLADGLSAGFDRERALAVMKRSDVGPSGVAAVVLALLVQVGATSGLVTSFGGLAVWVLAVAASRAGLAWACRRGVPAATPGGLGATVAGTVAPLFLALSTLALVGAAGLVGLATGRVGALFAPVAAVGATLLVLARARRGLGGVTGDVLGAVIEVALAAALTAAVLG